MPREVCWSCKLIKDDVSLCADDRLCDDCYKDNERRLASTNAAKSKSEQLAVVDHDTPEGFTGKVTLESKRPVGAGDDSAEHGSRSEVDKKGKGRAGANPTNTSSGRSSKKGVKASEHMASGGAIVKI